MTKHINKGFTTYPDSVCRPIAIHHYDGNKYCRVEYTDLTVPITIEDFFYEEDGKVFADVKRGYISKTPFDEKTLETWKRIPRINWWMLQGKKREAFKVVTKKRDWRMYDFEYQGVRLYDYEQGALEGLTKAEAIKTGLRLAKRYGLDMEFGLNTDIENNSGGKGSWNSETMVVTTDGLVICYNNRKTKGPRLTNVNNLKEGNEEYLQTLMPKYQRGHGSTRNLPYRSLNAWNQRGR